MVKDGSGPLPHLPLTKKWRWEYFSLLLVVGVAHCVLGSLMVADPRSKQVRKQKAKGRYVHQLVALVFALPMTMVVVTGCAYRLLRMMGLKKTGPYGVKWILHLHQALAHTLTHAMIIFE